MVKVKFIVSYNNPITIEVGKSIIPSRWKLFSHGPVEYEDFDRAERKVKNFVNCFNGLFLPKIKMSYHFQNGHIGVLKGDKVSPIRVYQIDLRVCHDKDK